jgi:DoxX-like family
MPSITSPGPASKKMLWTGRVMSALPALMLLFSAVMKLLMPPPVADGFKHLGFELNVVMGIGILQIICTVIYLIPRTAVLGAILLTGYMGGAIAVSLRVGDSYLLQFLFGVLLWGGLYLRDPRIRALIPLKQ